MNRQTGKEMHAYLVKYHVYQQLKADKHKANLSMTMPKFDKKWNIIYDSLRHFENGYRNIFTSGQDYHCLFIVFNLIHSLKIM